MASSEARRDALCRLATALAAGESSVRNVELAWNEPDAYLVKFAERLGDRGITTAIPDLAFIALIDALIAEKLCIECEWRVEPRELVKHVRALLRHRGSKGWKAPKLEEETIEELLRSVGSSLEALGVALCTLGHQSDSASLVLLSTEEVESATDLARQADVGRLCRWAAESGDPEPKATLHVEEAFALSVSFSAPPREYFALPGGLWSCSTGARCF